MFKEILSPTSRRSRNSKMERLKNLNKIMISSHEDNSLLSFFIFLSEQQIIFFWYDKLNEFQCVLLCVRELQTDEVEDFGSMGRGEILDKLAEFHLAVSLPCHIYHVDNFVST